VPSGPVDCTEVQWDTALLGLHHFLAGGHAERALACGWSRPELFNVPNRSSQIRLTGAAWLIGEWDVAAVDAEAITVSPPWSQSSQLKFRRQDDLHRLAAVTNVMPAAVPIPKVVRDSAADEVAISRFEEAAEATRGAITPGPVQLTSFYIRMFHVATATEANIERLRIRGRPLESEDEY
jgi:hypothetical protein